MSGIGPFLLWLPSLAGVGSDDHQSPHLPKGYPLQAGRRPFCKGPLVARHVSSGTQQGLLAAAILMDATDAPPPLSTASPSTLSPLSIPYPLSPLSPLYRLTPPLFARLRVGLDPHGMPSGGDWALQRSGALYLQGTEGASITDCLMTQLDGTAVFLSGYNRNTTISNNEVRILSYAVSGHVWGSMNGSGNGSVNGSGRWVGGWMGWRMDGLEVGWVDCQGRWVDCHGRWVDCQGRES